MRLVKIIDRSPLHTNDGKWIRWVQVQRGNEYLYGVFVCDTMEEAFAIQEGKLYDGNKPKFEQRIKGV